MVGSMVPSRCWCASIAVYHLMKCAVVAVAMADDANALYCFLLAIPTVINLVNALTFDVDKGRWWRSPTMSIHPL